MIEAFAALVGAAIVALAVTPLARSTAHRLGWVARPASDRWHTAPTAMLGGPSVALATAAGLGVAFLLWSPDERALAVTSLASGPALGVAGAAALMFLVGLLDDRIRMRAQTKFVLQVLAGTLLVTTGAVFRLTPWHVANVVITLFWFVAITNAFNLLDNMDGVAAGVGAIAAVFLGILNLRSGAWIHVAAAWALAGAALGFLRYNFSPATIFMGDAGSLFIGASIAGLLVSSPFTRPEPTSALILVPLTLVAVPILDTALVSVTRVLVGRSISQGGRDHSAHRMVALGLGERQVALLMYAAALLSGLVALAIVGLDGGLAVLVGTSFLTLLALLAAYAARLRIRYSDEALGLRRAAEILGDLLYKRRLGEVLLDAVLVTVAYYGAYRMRFDTVPPPLYQQTFESSVGIVIAIQIATLAGWGVYRGAWRYSSIIDLYRVIAAVATGGVVIFAVGSWGFETLDRSHSIVYIDALLTAALVLGARLSFRSLDVLRQHFAATGVRALIYGAGDGGVLALRELQNNPALGLTPICFLDDDPTKHGTQIHGVRVEGGWDAISRVVERHGIRRIVIGTKQLPPERLAAIQTFAADTDLEIVELDLQFRPVANGAHPKRERIRAPSRVSVA